MKMKSDPVPPRYPVDQPEGNIKPCVGGKLLKSAIGTSLGSRPLT